MPVSSRPRPTVAAPTLTPLPYGLLSVAAQEHRADPHTQFGVQYEPTSGVGPEGVVGIDVQQQPTGTLTAEVLADEFPTIFTEPFLIFSVVTGKFFGRTIGEIQEFGDRRLAAHAGRFIERGLQTGPSGGPALAAAGTTQLATAPVAPTVALGLVEEWIASTVGAQGVLHVPTIAIPRLAEHRQVAPSGAQMRTVLGTPVAVGAGYRNVAPGDVPAAAGVAWLYATGPVLVNRSETLLRSVPDGEKADLVHGSATAYATEVVSVGFEGGVVAVPISL
jgi:hypothetical protein